MHDSGIMYDCVIGDNSRVCTAWFVMYDRVVHDKSCSVNSPLITDGSLHVSGDMTKPTKWLCAQRRLRSDWADAQADLSLRWAHTHFIGFVMSWLMCLWRLITLKSGNDNKCGQLVRFCKLFSRMMLNKFWAAVYKDMLNLHDIRVVTRGN